MLLQAVNVTGYRLIRRTLICVVCAVQKSINGLLAEHVNQFSTRCCDLWQAKQLSLASPSLQYLSKGTERTVDLQPMQSPLFLLATR